MAQKLNLDFSIGESIVRGLNSTPDVEKGSVDIDITNVSLVGKTNALLETSNTTLELVQKNFESGSKNYNETLEGFKTIDNQCKQTSEE